MQHWFHKILETHSKLQFTTRMCPTILSSKFQSEILKHCEKQYCPTIWHSKLSIKIQTWDYLLLWNYTNLNSINTPMKKLHNGAFTRRMCQQSNKVQFQEDIKLWWKEINFEIKKEKKLNSQFPNFLWSEFRNPNAPSMKNTTPSNQVIKQTKNWTNPNKLSTPTLHICFRKKTEVLNYMKHQKKELTHHEKYHKEK